MEKAALDVLEGMLLSESAQDFAAPAMDLERALSGGGFADVVFG
jgi:hypothetical protein